MSDTIASLRRKIGNASELRSVVRTMKAVAAASVGQYERSVLALGDYYRTVELGLVAALRDIDGDTATSPPGDAAAVGAIVFGSDQGLVGQFNEIVADFAVKSLVGHGGGAKVFAVGERVQARLIDAGLFTVGLFSVPTSVNGISSLVGQLEIQSEARRTAGEHVSLYVFHNRPKSRALYVPTVQRLLPLDA